MTDDEPDVPIVCEECETTAEIPLSDLADQLEAHNERMHDGEAVAEVDPDVADQLADLIADELGLLDG
ncbi:hypothetical protein HLRTI_002553 [Halorhabdus tiamatea SARL4B]|uniref:DUF8149 domain-containing protein n=1 Tax=Halorhabdus tiamatea SARL4B TaxID=1033806 RepID=F7PLG5_9EURY|nr:hypothetical protein [Halorhabdus tiamatea]ERJ05481.1 hypothetical protein HLRTI_002553 [Halorhabdus tiamatea SARL4B]CCQ33595.1 conserved hypothetical protein [Halorhabdus tiamatea SARL4B]